MIRKHSTSAHRKAFDAIRQKFAEKNTLQAQREAEILDPLRAERREMLEKLDAMTAAVALAQKQLDNKIAEKQLENKIAEKRKVPPRKRGEGKSHRVNMRAKAQRAAKKAAKQAEAEAAERASAERAEARRLAKQAEAEAVDRASTKRAEARREAKQAATFKK